MKVWSEHISWLVCCILCNSFQTSCSIIDDDLTDCDQEYELNYEMRLVTNMTTELQTQLSTQTNAVVANALRNHLENVFSDYAHDVDLSFYGGEANSSRLKHETPIMNANQHSFSLNLPVQKYMHLAAANLKDNAVVSLVNDEHCSTSMLLQEEPANNILPSHNTGIFTARQPMEVVGGVNQQFHVRLYMANCAAALVLEPREYAARDIRVVTTGFATAFNIEDSTYVFPKESPLIQAEPLTTADDGLYSFCTVNFPSPEAESSRVVIETTDPFVAKESTNGLWEYRIYVTNADGTVTATTLSMRRPLRAGQVLIVKGFIADDGSVRTDEQDVGVSVTLDWNEGGKYEVET